MQHVVTFSLAKQRYAVLLDSVIEVLRLVEVKIVPDSPPDVLGVINFRGQVIPLIDLRQTLGLPPLTLHLNTPFIVLTTGSRTFALAVDSIDDVAAVTITADAATPDTHHQLVQVVIPHAGDLLMLLDLSALTTVRV